MDNLQAEKWNEVASNINFTIEPDFSLFHKYISLSSKILDYGCGYGRIANQLYSNGYKDIVGYDTSSGMIERGKLLFPHLDLKTSNSIIIDSPENYYDAIICCAVLTCIPDQANQLSVIQEFKRLLKPSGILYLAEFGRNEQIEYDDHGHFKTGFDVRMKHFQSDELLNLLKDFDQTSFSNSSTKSISGSEHVAYHFVGRL
ncbi:MAG: class I SAM-dependent methyltransferase [Pseudomonadota bacterium]